LQKAQQAGKISAATAIPIILRGMDDQFRGLMAKESTTLGGIWSNLHDAVQQGLVRMVSPYLPAMKQWLQQLVDAMPQIEAFLRQVLTQGIAKVKIGIEVGRQVVDSIETAVGTGDWGPIGAALGTKLRDALIGGGGAAGGVDWFDIGKSVAGGAIGFVFGFLAALFDPVTWWPVIQKHWWDILLTVIMFVPIGRAGGILGKVLAKLPFLGKIGEWLVGVGARLEKAGGPVWKLVSGIARAIGRAFTRVFPEASVGIHSFFTRIEWFFTGGPGGKNLAKRIGGAISGALSRALEDASTNVLVFLRLIGEDIGKTAKRLWRPFGDAFKAILDWVVGKWNQFLGVITAIPGVGAILGGQSGGGNGGTNPQAPSQIPPGAGLRFNQRPANNAAGGTMTAGGMSWVGERGPELLNLPRGAKVIPLPRVPEFAGGRHIEIPVVLNGREIARAVYDDMDDRMARR
jgi:hypothetical protein